MKEIKSRRKWFGKRRQTRDANFANASIHLVASTGTVLHFLTRKIKKLTSLLIIEMCWDVSFRDVVFGGGSWSAVTTATLITNERSWKKASPRTPDSQCSDTLLQRFWTRGLEFLHLSQLWLSFPPSRKQKVWKQRGLKQKNKHFPHTNYCFPFPFWELDKTVWQKSRVTEPPPSFFGPWLNNMLE